MRKLWDEERTCEDCGQSFWSCAPARFCSQRCRKRAWRSRQACPRGTDVQALCEAVVRRSFPHGTTDEQTLGRLLRAAAAQLRRTGTDPIEVLLATPDDPTTLEEEAPGGVEGEAPSRRRFRLTVEEELAALARIIETREANGHSTDWHHARRAQLARRLLRDVKAQLAGEP